MRPYDFSPLYRSFVGFDRMAGLIDSAVRDSAQSYPPYNIAQLSEDEYRIELAVAGFSEDELAIQTHQNVLTITGAQTEAPVDDAVSSAQYLHRGIAARGFERRFQLADHVHVTGASLKNGLLTLALRREVPEALKPRKIAIGSAMSSSAPANDEKLIAQTSTRKGNAA